MSMSDPIADMLTRLRNGLGRERAIVELPSSKLKVAIAKVLAEEGYLSGYDVGEDDSGRAQLALRLKYYQGKPVIHTLKRASKPSRRMYRGKDDLPRVNAGLGITIVSTPQGVMTERAAQSAGVGGEILCYVA